jgi:hypothetical protein
MGLVAFMPVFVIACLLAGGLVVHHRERAR